MDSLLSIFFLLATGAVYFLIATYASRRVNSQESYLLGGRSFGTMSITMTLIATQLGAGMIFGTAQQSYEQGYFGLAYILGMAMGLLILGMGIAGRLRDLKITTTAELFEKHYKSKSLRKSASIISIFTMGGILAAQITASKQLFVSLFDLSIYWLILFWLIIIFYTMFGGIKAIIATDIFQVIMIVVVFTIVLFIIVPLADMPTLLSYTNKNPIPNFSQSIFATLIAPILFSMIEQDLGVRFFAAKNRHIATRSALLAAFFLVLYSLVPMFLGIYARSENIHYPVDGSPLVALLQQNLSNLGMTIVACALLAAICSTADSLLGAAASNLIADFNWPKSRYSLWLSRLLTFLLGLSALVVALFFNNIIQIIVTSYEISICALFVPLIMAVFKISATKKAAYASVLSGTAAFFVLQFIPLAISSTLVSLLVSCAAFVIFNYSGPKK